MKIGSYINPFRNADKPISVTVFGADESPIGFSRAPHIRREYVLQYITEGVVYYEADGKEYTINAGDVFLVRPNQKVKWWTEKDKRICGYWIDFVGKAANRYLADVGMSGDILVVKGVSEGFCKAIDDAFRCVEREQYSQLYLEACLLKCLSFLDKANNFKTNKIPQKEKYIKNALAFMEKEYQNKITVGDVAEYLGLERSYFYRIFKEEMGTSPSEYLIELRLERAKELLELGESVKSTAHSVGMDDVFYFSKLFSSRLGLPPSAFRSR